MPLCPAQISHEMAYDKTQASEMPCRRLNASVISNTISIIFKYTVRTEQQTFLGVTGAYRNNRWLFRDPHKTHKYTVHMSVEFLDV